MMTPDPMAQRFLAGKQLAPWQNSASRFDFNQGFVDHIRKYLAKLNAVSDAAAAKAWINKGFFNPERLDLVYLQWDEYEQHKKSKQCATAGNCLPDSPDVRVAESDSVGAVDAHVEPEVPEEFRKKEGETGEEYRARLGAMIKSKVAATAEKFDFGKK